MDDEYEQVRMLALKGHNVWPVKTKDVIRGWPEGASIKMWCGPKVTLSRDTVIHSHISLPTGASAEKFSRFHELNARNASKLGYKIVQFPTFIHDPKDPVGVWTIGFVYDMNRAGTQWETPTEPLPF